MRTLSRILKEVKSLGPIGSLRASFFTVTNPSRFLGWLSGVTEPNQNRFERILCVIPSSPKSGGHSTIFRLTNGLARLGRDPNFMTGNPNAIAFLIDRKLNFGEWIGFDCLDDCTKPRLVTPALLLLSREILMGEKADG